MYQSLHQSRRTCFHRDAVDPLALSGEEFTLAIRRLGMSTRDVADAFGVTRWDVREWESGAETAPRVVALALREEIDEQDQEIERQVARLSHVADPRFENRRGGMEGHTFEWWHYVARQVTLRLGRVLTVNAE